MHFLYKATESAALSRPAGPVANQSAWHLHFAILAAEHAACSQEVGQKVAMHAVAMKPRYLSPETVPAEALEGKA